MYREIAALEHRILTDRRLCFGCELLSRVHGWHCRRFGLILLGHFAPDLIAYPTQQERYLAYLELALLPHKLDTSQPTGSRLYRSLCAQATQLARRKMGKALAHGHWLSWLHLTLKLARCTHAAKRRAA